MTLRKHWTKTILSLFPQNPIVVVIRDFRQTAKRPKNSQRHLGTSIRVFYKIAYLLLNKVPVILLFNLPPEIASTFLYVNSVKCITIWLIYLECEYCCFIIIRYLIGYNMLVVSLDTYISSISFDFCKTDPMWCT